MNATAHLKDTPREVQIAAYAIDSLYRSLARIVPTLLIMPLVMGVVMWNHVDRVVLLSWLAVALVIFAIRRSLYVAYTKRRPAPGDARGWADRYTYTALLSGLSWGAAGALFFVPDSIALQLFMCFCIVGLAAGSLIAMCYWLPAYYAFTVPALSLSAIRLAYEGTGEYLGIAALLVMYMLIIAIGARSQNRSARDAISLRFENLDLVAQLREQKEIAERANVAKSKFLAAASHDLRQPLHALGLFVAALEEPTSRQDRGTLVQNINRSLHALEGLFNALLDISKLDAGVVKPEIRDVALMPLLDRLSAEYEPQAQAKALAWRYSAGPAVVRTDIALLETVLRNLIGNAIRYTRHGEVRLTCTSAGARVRIEVADTGVGIPSEQHQEVFREFVQLHNPERDRAKGLGLGLAIVDRLTKLLDHPLEMRSTPGRGTVFVLQLPLGDAAAAEVASDAETDAPARAERALRVLVIEDEVDARQALTTLLESWGHEVIAVASQNEAVAIAGPAPDAIISDYRLRDENTGAEAIRRVQAAWGAAIPALIITGDTAPERLRQAQQSGFVLLHKPVSPGKLRAFLRGVQRGHSARPAA